MFSTFSTGFSTTKRDQPYTHRNSGSRFLESFGRKCRHSAFYKKESRRIFFAFYKPFLSGDLFFSNLEWSSPKFSTPGRCRFSVWKRRGKLQFSTPEKCRRRANDVPLRGNGGGQTILNALCFFTGGAFGSTVQFPAKAQSLRARQRLPPRGSWQNR